LAVWSVDALRDLIIREEEESPEVKGTLDYFSDEDFKRDDESPDTEFYKKPRLVDHLDSMARSTVEELYLRLIPEQSRILDLMAGPDSHLVERLKPQSVVGLGLNQEELNDNSVLTERVIHDLNADISLPFDENEFDVVVNTVSVDYMTRPLEVFREVARILRPGGLFVVVFSNRMFPPKAVRIWKRTNEAERMDLVKRFFSLSGRFSAPESFESTGKPRPEDDKYYDLGIPSDPIYALWATVRK
jgi:SAM-dependent methyltransferase